jgi:hypothetical protein
MKSGVLALCAVILVSTASIGPSRADTYDISASSNGITVGGFIETTNGAGGFLNSSEITDYEITIGSSQITPSNNTATFLTGTILFANGSTLSLDFGDAGILDASLSGSGDNISGTYWFNCGEGIPCTQPDSMAVNSSIGSTGEVGHIVQIGTLAAPPPSPTPLPATLPLLVTGLSALGLFGWRRKRKAAGMAA